MPDVSAVLVTRGDVDLQPILDLIPFDDVVIWNNSEREDMKTYGRHLAEAECKHDVIYHQDDDILFHDFDGLLAAYRPGRITANMPSPWYEDVGYEQKRQVMLGGGSLIDRGLARKAFDKYLAEYPFDDDFITYCDCIVGALTPSFRVDLGFEVLPQATWPNRMSTTPGCWDRKHMMDRRAFALRDGHS